MRACAVSDSVVSSLIRRLPPDFEDASKQAGRRGFFACSAAEQDARWFLFRTFRQPGQSCRGSLLPPGPPARPGDPQVAHMFVRAGKEEEEVEAGTFSSAPAGGGAPPSMLRFMTEGERTGLMVLVLRDGAFRPCPAVLLLCALAGGRAGSPTPLPPPPLFVRPS